MRTAIILAVAIAALTSIPLLAQEAGAGAQDNSSIHAGGAGTHISNSNQAGASAHTGPTGTATEVSESNDGKATYARTGGGFGDQAASHAWEMSTINGELEKKLDSKTAKPGEQVILKTTEKVQTSNGTLIPKGSRLIGHVTEVQAWSKEHGAAQMGITFDRVEMKGGHSVPIYTLIKGLTPNANAMAMGAMDADGGFAAPMGGPAMGGPAMGGGRAGGGLIGGAGGALGGAGGTLNGAGGIAGGAAGGVGGMAGSATGGAMDSTGATASTVGSGAGAGLGSTENAAVHAAGHGDLNVPTGAHAAAAQRAIPHPTRIPGLMLAGNGSASGLLLASRKNIELESGTQMQLGIVAQ